jgi:hypothetical protein
MIKTFRGLDIEQRRLLPPSVHEVPAGHAAHFMRDAVREDPDLSARSFRFTAKSGATLLYHRP